MGGDPDVRQARVVAVTGPGDGVRLLLTVLLAGWVLSYGYSMFELSGFLDKAMELQVNLADQPVLRFLGWQAIAGLFAIAIYGVSRLWPRGAAARQLSNLPLLLAVLLVAAISGVVLLGPPA